jgi:predicted Fe-Mo cluster-binding NifX family protein
MKIAIASTGKDLAADVADNFGRCPYFLIVTTENKEIRDWEVIENTSVSQTEGAGIAAAKIVVGKDAQVVIAGAVGPRAMEVLGQFNTEVCSANGKIEDVINDFLKDENCHSH